MLLVASRAWSLLPFRHLAILLRECCPSEAIRLSLLVHLAVGIGSRAYLVLVATFVCRVIQLHIHRIFPCLIEVLAGSVVGLECC